MIALNVILGRIGLNFLNVFPHIFKLLDSLMTSDFNNNDH